MQGKSNKKTSIKSADNNYSYMKKCFNLFLHNLNDKDK